MVAKAKIDPILAEANKRYGEGTLVLASDPSLQMSRIPTGILSMDLMLGGGLPRGRHVEFLGQPSTTKSTIALYAIAEAQRRGGKCAYMDTESTYSQDYAEHLGVDQSKLTYHRQRNANQMLGIVEYLARSGEYELIVLDSIAALIPLPELERDIEQPSMKTDQARLMSEALRRLTAANKGTVYLWINQVRESMAMFGEKWRTSGGRAMGFYASTRVEFVRSENIKGKTKVADPNKGSVDKEVPIAYRVTARNKKQKAGWSDEMDSISLVYDKRTHRIDPLEDLMYVGIRLGEITVAKRTWTLDGQDFVGRARLKHHLADMDVAEALRERLAKKVYGEAV